MPARPPETVVDINAVVAGVLRDLAAVQTVKQSEWGYTRAARAVFDLERQLTELQTAGGALPKIPAVGPSSLRVILEALESGASPTVERAVAERGKEDETARRRALRSHFLSRAAVIAALGDRRRRGPSVSDYRADLQMHSTWSDGGEPVAALAAAALTRGYTHLAVTDHSHGLPIARGMTMDAAAAQHREIDDINSQLTGAFRVLKGVEANIQADGSLDLSEDEVSQFEIVLAAPHSGLRSADDQTARLLAAVSTPGVRILAHPRGRKYGARAGVQADWDLVFALATQAGVAVEIDGDPSRQDLDWTLARRALEAGCLFALDSDAHSSAEFVYAETAIAHARLAGIPADRIINCWPTAQLMDWLASGR
jgi:histidinol phosphatase-like PHP family hydrolase